MSFDGHHIEVMSCKTWANWIFWVGCLFSPGVHMWEGSFKIHVTERLLPNQYFMLKNFQDPSKSENGNSYTRLSIINILCSNWINADKRKYSKQVDDINKTDLEIVLETFEKILKHNKDPEMTVETFCNLTECNYSYSTSYLTPAQLEEKYEDIKNLTDKLPECPSPQDIHSTTLRMNNKTTTPIPALTSSSPSQISQTTTPSVFNSTLLHSSSTPYEANDSSTLTPSSTENKSINSSSPTLFSTTTHQNTNSSSPTPFSTTTHQNTTSLENPGSINKQVDSTSQNGSLLLTALLTLSVMANVALILTVWFQRRRINLIQFQDVARDNHSSTDSQPILLQIIKNPNEETILVSDQLT